MKAIILKKQKFVHKLIIYFSFIFLLSLTYMAILSLEKSNHIKDTLAIKTMIFSVPTLLFSINLIPHFAKIKRINIINSFSVIIMVLASVYTLYWSSSLWFKNNRLIYVHATLKYLPTIILSSFIILWIIFSIIMNMKKIKDMISKGKLKVNNVVVDDLNNITFKSIMRRISKLNEISTRQLIKNYIFSTYANTKFSIKIARTLIFIGGCTLILCGFITNAVYLFKNIESNYQNSINTRAVVYSSFAMCLGIILLYTVSNDISMHIVFWSKDAKTIQSGFDNMINKFNLKEYIKMLNNQISVTSQNNKFYINLEKNSWRKQWFSIISKNEANYEFTKDFRNIKILSSSNNRVRLMLNTNSKMNLFLFIIILISNDMKGGEHETI